MKIAEHFNIIAKEYDSKRKMFIPCFTDYYETTTNFIAANIAKPNRIIDLGSGTGLLAYFWYKHFPDCEYILVDIAEDMLDVARKRFLGISNVHYEVEDYSKALPVCGEVDCIISALSIHHLEDENKKELFSEIYNKLPAGGVFVNYDQFRADTPTIDRWFDSFWLEQLNKSDLSSRDIELGNERRKLDRECSVESEVSMLKHCGFKEVNCVYSYHKFSVIVAIK